MRFRMMKSLLPRQDVFKFLFACLAIEFVEIKLIPGYFVNVLIYIIIRIIFFGINKDKFVTFGIPCKLFLFATPIIPASIVGIEADSKCIRIVIVRPFPRANKSRLVLLCRRILLSAVTVFVVIVTAGNECKGGACQCHEKHDKALSKIIFHKLYV